MSAARTVVWAAIGLASLAGAAAAAVAQGPPPPREIAESQETRGIRRAPALGAVPEPDWSRAFVSMFILAHTWRGEVGFVEEGTCLRSGEQFEVYVRVASPAFVYIMQINSKGHADMLFPEESEQGHLEPGITHRMPADAKIRFELDKVVGTERVVLVATKKPLGSDEPALTSLVRIVRQSGRWPAELAGAGAPPSAHARRARDGSLPVSKRAGASGTGTEDPHPGPTRVSETTRGIPLDTGSSGRALDLQADSAGVAVAVLHFQHLP